MPYGYDSVMHYRAHAFTKNKKEQLSQRKANCCIYFDTNLSVLRQHLWFYIKAIRLIKTQTNHERQEVKQQSISAEAWVHSQVNLSSNYGS